MNKRKNVNIIFDKQNGLYYERQGDYYLPCLSLGKAEDKPTGIWGQRHLRYIRQYKRVFYANLLTSGRLNNYLAGIDEQANKMFSDLVKRLAENENITENLKTENPILWVKNMNNIRNRATEMVNQELIFI